MRWHKAAGLAGFWPPGLHPCLTVLKIRQTLLPIGVSECPRIADNWRYSPPLPPSGSSS